MGRESFSEEILLLDTNIFLEMLLRQQRAEECRLMLERLSVSGVAIALTTFALYSIELNLEQHGREDLLAPFLTDCKNGNFLLMTTQFHDEENILSIIGQQQLDFDDAHQYWAAKKLGARLVSFDADFDKTDLRRFEPAAILKELQ